MSVGEGEGEGNGDSEAETITELAGAKEGEGVMDGVIVGAGVTEHASKAVASFSIKSEKLNTTEYL